MDEFSRIPPPHSINQLKVEVRIRPQLARQRGLQLPVLDHPSLLTFWDKFFAPEPSDAPWKSKLRQEIFSHFFDIVRAMNESGVPLMAGTDFGARDIYPGVSYTRNFIYFRKPGMSNLDILRAATMNPANCMGLSADYGSIAKGKVADILIVNENPLLVLGTLGHPSRIIHDGVVLQTPSRGCAFF